MTFAFFNQRFVVTSALSMLQDNLIKIPIGWEKNDKQFLMGNSIESTVKFTKRGMYVKTQFLLVLLEG